MILSSKKERQEWANPDLQGGRGRALSLEQMCWVSSPALVLQLFILEVGDHCQHLALHHLPPRSEQLRVWDGAADGSQPIGPNIVSLHPQPHLHCLAVEALQATHSRSRPLSRLGWGLVLPGPFQKLSKPAFSAHSCARAPSRTPGPLPIQPFSHVPTHRSQVPM